LAACFFVGVSTVILLAAFFCAAQQNSRKLANHDITEMVSLGLSGEFVIDIIHTAEATDFDTSGETMKTLKAAQVSDNIIRAMISPHPSIAGNANPADEQKAAAKGDPNDPNSSQDPSICMYAKTRNGVQMVMLEPRFIPRSSKPNHSSRRSRALILDLTTTPEDQCFVLTVPAQLKQTPPIALLAESQLVQRHRQQTALSHAREPRPRMQN